HPAPQVLADVELETFNLGLIREEDVLRGEERRPRVAGIVVCVREPRREAVAIVRAAQNLVLLVPVAIYADVPLARILVLMRAREECRALLNHGLEWLGHEKFERRPPAVTVLHPERVLAQSGETDAIHAGISRFR